MSTFADLDVPSDRKLPVLLLVDVSGSMSQHGKLAAQNESIAQMIDGFVEDTYTRGVIRLAVITFGGEAAELALEPADVGDLRWVPPDVAAGRTPMGAALAMANDLLSDQRLTPENAYKPMIVLTSDGLPTDGWQGPFDELLNSRRGRQANRIAIAIGEDADETMLARFVSEDAQLLHAQEGKDIVEFFRRRSACCSNAGAGRSRSPSRSRSSDSTTSNSWPPRYPPSPACAPTATRWATRPPPC